MTETITAPAQVSAGKRIALWWIGVLAIVGAVLMIVTGGVVWGVVSGQLADQKITVSEDAPFLGGATVADPFSALAQAEAINMHAMKMADGKTYAELEQDDPLRATVMDASFLRASLFTSVVSFGVAFFAIGAGILIGLLGWAVTVLSGKPVRVRAAAR